MPRRFDLMPMQSRLDTETGFLHTRIRPTRTGVFEYRRADGTISRELKHPEDVFDAESLESLKRLVITRGHPRTPDGRPLFVNSANVEKLGVGHLGDSIERENIGGQDHPVVWGTVTKRDVVESITSRRREMVSLGYECVYDETPGEYLGQPYDRRHRNIRYNHCAVDIERGRGGFTVAMALDEDDAFTEVDPSASPSHRVEDETMHTIKIGNLTVEVKDAQAGTIITDALDSAQAKADTATRERDGMAAKLDATNGELEAAQAKLDQATKELAESKKKLDSAPAHTDVREVITLLDSVGELLGLDAAKKAELLDAEVPEGSTLVETIRRDAVLAVLTDEADALASKSAAYFEARFDGLLASARKQDGTTALATALAKGGAKPTAHKKGDQEEADDVQKLVDEAISVGDPLALTQVPAHAISV